MPEFRDITTIRWMAEFKDSRVQTHDLVHVNARIQMPEIREMRKFKDMHKFRENS
jgi:hypothetical protein